MKATEIHHISYEPEITKEIPLEKHREIHGNVSNKSELTTLMRQYDKLVKLSVMVKNWQTAFSKEFGEEKKVIDFKGIETEKREILKVVRKLIKDDYKRVNIKGVGVRCLAGILAYADPRRFKSLSTYLAYCGYKGCKYYKTLAKGYTKGNLKKAYHQRAHYTAWLATKSLMTQKNEKYRLFYWKVRGNLSKDLLPMKAHDIAMNKVATFFLKDLYDVFSGRTPSGTRINATGDVIGK